MPLMATGENSFALSGNEKRKRSINMKTGLILISNWQSDSNTNINLLIEHNHCPKIDKELQVFELRFLIPSQTPFS
jgi:hypothetical protein